MPDDLKNISSSDLNEILSEHKDWFDSEGEKGEPADLSNTDLSEHELCGLYYLSGTNFRGAKLGDMSGSAIQGVYFDKHTDFSKANLQDTTIALVDFERGDVNISTMEKANLPEELHQLWRRQKNGIQNNPSAKEMNPFASVGRTIQPFTIPNKLGNSNPFSVSDSFLEDFKNTPRGRFH